MTDSSTASAAAPLVAAVAPYIVAAASVAVPALVGWGLAELRKLTGIQVEKSAADKLDKLIEDEVGALVAGASDNLATATLRVGSPLVAAVANKVVAGAPEILAKAGVDPADVAGMVAGEIGKWQASMTRVSPPPAPPPAKAP